MRAFHRRAGCKVGATVSDRYHRYQRLYRIVCLGVEWRRNSRIRLRRCNLKRFVDLGMRLPELLVGCTEMRVKEVGHVRVVTRPPQQVNAVTLARRRAALDELRRFHLHDLGVDAQVLTQLGLDVRRHITRCGQVAAGHIAIVNRRIEAIGESGIRQHLLGCHRIEVVPRLALATAGDRTRSEV